jgi:hypothetical protein
MKWHYNFCINIFAMFFLGMNAEAIASPIDACWQASFKTTGVKTVVLTEDQDEGIQYFSFENLTYGLKNQGQDGFIKLNKAEFNLAKIQWKFKIGANTGITVRNNDVNTMLGEVSKIKENGKIWYCLSMPFGGLGSSGHLAQYKVVLVIPKTAKNDNEVFGVIGVNMLEK